MLQSSKLSSLLRNIPNILSGARLAAAPVLYYAVYVRMEELFAWLLLACIVSDMLDGIIARSFHLHSRLGAILDSLADIAMLVGAIAGLFRFQPTFMRDHYLPFAWLIGLYAFNICFSLLRYGKVSSFHTYGCRLAGYLGAFFIISLFFFGYVPILFYAFVLCSLAAVVEETLLVIVLSEWTSDVKGLFWVLKKRDPRRLGTGSFAGNGS